MRRMDVGFDTTQNTPIVIARAAAAKLARDAAHAHYKHGYASTVDGAKLTKKKDNDGKLHLLMSTYWTMIV